MSLAVAVVCSVVMMMSVLMMVWATCTCLKAKITQNSRPPQTALPSSRLLMVRTSGPCDPVLSVSCVCRLQWSRGPTIESNPRCGQFCVLLNTTVIHSCG